MNGHRQVHPTYGPNVQIRVYDASQGSPALIYNAAGTGIGGWVPFSSSTFTNPNSVAADFYVKMSTLFYPIHDFAMLFWIGGTHCGDERDDIIEEYALGGSGYPPVQWIPSCDDFDTDGSTVHFFWSELNQSPGSGHPPWGIVRDVLWSGLEDTRANYSRGGIRITSGYRCPHGNKLISPPGADQSRHMWGDAADMKSAEHEWNEAEWVRLKDAALAAGATFYEPYSWDPSHLHADWR